MPGPVDARQRVLVEDAGLRVLPARLMRHRIVSHKLQHPEAVVRRVDPRRRVDDELLARLGVRQ